MVAADTLLSIWEEGAHCHPAERALRLLAIAVPDQDRETLADLDLSARDWHLFQLRRRLFTRRLSGVADCPACGEQLEIEIDVDTLGTEPPPDAPDFFSRTGRRFRLPTARDLVAIAGEPPESGARRLFERCALDLAAGDPVPPDLFDEADAGLAALASKRALHLDVACVCCGERSRQTIDAGEFLWSEIAAAAGALLDDVHRLAAAYGWSERDILSMSAARRAAYLARIQP